MRTIQYWVDHLRLRPHPEGGYFRETFRSGEVYEQDALPCRYDAPRNYYTAIYFLITANSFSAFHRLKSDEIWHFYDGDSLELIRIDETGKLVEQVLGNDPEQGENLQIRMSRGQWFAARVKTDDEFSLVGCTVAPGFEFADFELADTAKLKKQFPEHGEIIDELTR